ncbi:polysaccharide pyruvyl transferase family protein [Corynebacterium gerontici]|uniref:Polysaccharide pyruvyl transferase n=1 Tax=Corynebacterium gerontici TaxID=2079234 RepID=A0A3G6J2H8_9CORY|nr:polysaccharide pyruvyl transferase family protein [Corynebacterium gerontici]AZA12265.1 Polysaccharide pyruvyl transferase [Corynebacterium gerontici]
MSAKDSLIYLVAPAGHPNFGDEYIVASWLRTLAELRPDARVILDCHSPGRASLLHHNHHPDLIVTNTLWDLAGHAYHATADHFGLDPAQPEGFHAEAYEYLAHTAVQLLFDAGPHPEHVTGTNIARTADVVHILGGGWLNDFWPKNVAVCAMASQAGAEHARRFATGQGVVPLEQARAVLVDSLQRCDVVDVRDAASRDLLQAAGLQPSMSGDDAWLGINSPEHSEGVFGPGADDARERPFVLCAQADLLRSNAADAAAWIHQGLQHYGVCGEELSIIECIPGIDGQIWRELHQRWPERYQGFRFVAFDELWAFGVPVTSEQTWLSTRYHPHMIAAAAGAKGVALEMHRQDYYAVKHEAVQAAGSSWPMAHLSATQQDPWPQPGKGIDPDQVQQCRDAKWQLAQRCYPPEPEEHIDEPEQAPEPPHASRRLGRLVARVRGDER